MDGDRQSAGSASGSTASGSTASGSTATESMDPTLASSAEPNRTSVQGRRTWLGSAATVGAWVLAGGGTIGILRASERQGARSSGTFSTGVAPASLDAARVLGPVVLVPRGQGMPLALDRRCTHLGCLVGLADDGKHLACPCHGSVFDLRGEPVHGPAAHRLHVLPLDTDEEGKIVVHGLS